MTSSAAGPDGADRDRTGHGVPPSVQVITERLKERVYAQLSVVAVTIGLALAEPDGAGAAASAVAATAFGLWLATIAADQQAHVAVYGRVARGRDLQTLLFRTSPLLTAAVGPVLMIGLAALEVLPLVPALYLAAGVDLALMFVWGFGLGRRMGAGLLAALLSGLVNLVIGLMVVGVKLLAGH